MSETRLEASSSDVVREIEALLGRRVDELQRESRMLKRNGVLMTIGIATVLLMGSMALISLFACQGQEADVVEAHRFVLRDGDGHIRGLMGCTTTAPRG